MHIYICHLVSIWILPRDWSWKYRSGYITWLCRSDYITWLVDWLRGWLIGLGSIVLVTLHGWVYHLVQINISA